MSTLTLDPAPPKTSAAPQPAPETRGHSRRARCFLGVLAFVAVVFVGLEIFTRSVLFQESKDFSRFVTYPERAQRLSDHAGCRLALIGNSTTELGVDPQQLADELAVQRPSVHFAADAFVADASKVNSWFYMANHYFWQDDRPVEAFVVHFYEDNLADGNRLEIGRFAQFFVDTRDWSDVFQHEITSPAQRLEFVLSSGWATFAARDRIRERVLKAAVPDFAGYTQATNDRAFRLEQARAKSSAPDGPKTYRTLTRLMERAQARGAQVCFVAFPTRPCRAAQPYEVRPELVQTIERAGQVYLDGRDVPGITLDMYEDELHLTDAGRRIYTAFLARQLALLLKPPL